MGRPKKTTDNPRERIRSRLAARHTVSAVARELNLSRATVISICSDTADEVVAKTRNSRFGQRSTVPPRVHVGG
jgi:hypothetical protein